MGAQCVTLTHPSLERIPSCPAADLCGSKGRARLGKQILPEDERLAVERHLREFDRLGEDLAVDLAVIERDPFIADFDPQGIEENNRIDRVERPALPFTDLVYDANPKADAANSSSAQATLLRQRITKSRRTIRYGYGPYEDAGSRFSHEATIWDTAGRFPARGPRPTDTRRAISQVAPPMPEFRQWSTARAFPLGFRCIFKATDNQSPSGRPAAPKSPLPCAKYRPRKRAAAQKGGWVSY